MNTQKIIQVVTRLLSTNGRDIIVGQLSTTALDTGKPWQGQTDQDVINKVSTHGVFVPISGTMELGEILNETELFGRSSEVCLVPPGTVDIAEYNVILDHGIVWHVDFVKVLRPATEVMLYVFGLSR